ncbi:MAG: hypothetical protein R2762_16970 [Bryobacteraceae bacterium]
MNTRVTNDPLPLPGFQCAGADDSSGVSHPIEADEEVDDSSGVSHPIDAEESPSATEGEGDNKQ